MKHTPGPWRTNGPRVYRDDLDGATLICEALPLDYDASGAERRANARLIAAAPELLAAAHRCIAALEANGAPNCEAVKELRAAISKTEGYRHV